MLSDGAAETHGRNTWPQKGAQSSEVSQGTGRDVMLGFRGRLFNSGGDSDGQHSGSSQFRSLKSFLTQSYTTHSSLPSRPSAQAANHRAPPTLGTLNCFQLHLLQPSLASLLVHSHPCPHPRLNLLLIPPV